MSSFEAKKILRYGQVIRIHGSNKGIIISKGFLQKSVFYQQYKLFSKINNYRESLFQVLPKGSFEIHDEFMKCDNDRDLFLNRMKTELDQYFSFVNSKINEEVHFGQDIVLRHVDSGSYLTGSYLCSEFTTDAFKVELQNILSSQALFKVNPFSSYQKAGQVIYFDEPLLLMSDRQKFFLNFYEGGLVSLDRFQTTNSQRDALQGSQINCSQFDKLDQMIHHPQSDCKRFEMILSHNHQTSWRLKLHETNEQRKDRVKIKPFELIQLQFSKNQSYLSYDSQLNQVVLKQINHNYVPLDAIWEIQPIPIDLAKQKKKIVLNLGNQNQSIVIASPGNLQCSPLVFPQISNMESVNQFDNHLQYATTRKQINFAQEVVFRHYITGKTLTINLNEYHEKIASIQGTLINDTSQIIELNFAKQGENELQNNSYVNISFGNSTLQSINKNTTKVEEQDKEHPEHIIHQLRLLDQKSLDAFMIQKVSSEVKLNMQMVLSVQEELYYFVNLLKSGENQYIFYHFIILFYLRFKDNQLNNVIEILKSLVRYIQNLGENIDPEKSEAEPIQERQRCIKELWMIEIFIMLTDEISNGSMLNMKEKYQKIEKEKLNTILNLTYQIIMKLMYDNQPIKLHFSQYLQIFLKQAMTNDLTIINESLNELLDDNYNAISQFITYESIQQVVNAFNESFPHEKYLRILSAMCICKGHAFVFNQNHVLDLFFRGTQQMFSFQFVDNHVLISYWDSQLSLKQLWEASQETDQGQVFGYFCAFVNLLADICCQRNLTSQEFVKELLPLDLLCKLINDAAQLETNALESFLKVMQYCYVESQYYQPIRFISHIKEWQKLDKSDQISHLWSLPKNLLPENTDLKNVMQFLVEHLRKFTHFDRRKRSQTRLMLRVLEVLKSTIELGFWISMSDLKQIIQILLKVCSCSVEFQEFLDTYENQSDSLFEIQQAFNRRNVDNDLIMQNKALACEMIELILDIETDVRLNKLVEAMKPLVDQEQAYEDQLNNSVEVVVESRLNWKSALNFFLSLLNKNSSVQVVFYNINIIKHHQLAKEVQQDKDKSLYSLDGWIDRCKSMMSERDLFYNLAEGVRVELVFTEISMSQSPKMLQKALRQLSKTHEQRKSLFTNFQKCTLVSTEQLRTMKLVEKARLLLVKIKPIADSEIFLIDLYNQEAYDIYIWKESDRIDERGIIQEIYAIAQNMKKPLYARNMPLDQACNSQFIRTVVDENELNEPTHQMLLKSMDIHVILIKYIILCSNLTPEQSLQLQLLEVCYEFLTLMIWNNPNAKNDLDIPMNYVIKHLSISTCCVGFIKELFSNNRELLNRECLVIMVVQSILSEANKLDFKDYRKSLLIETLRIMQFDRNKTIKANQILILSNLQSKQNSNLMISLNQMSNLDAKEVDDSQMNTLWNAQMFLEWINDYKKQDIIRQSKASLCPELMYLATYFNLFSVLIEDRNKLNAEKCKNTHPYKTLIYILKESINCWNIQHHVRAYVNRLYYRYHNYENISQIFIEYELDSINDQLQKILLLRMSSLLGPYKEIIMVPSVRFTNMYTSIYGTLQEILFTLMQVLVNERFLVDLEEVLYSQAKYGSFNAHIALFRLGSLVYQMEKSWFKSDHIVSLCQTISTVLRCIYGTFSYEWILECEQKFIPKTQNKINHSSNEITSEQQLDELKNQSINYIINSTGQQMNVQESQLQQLQLSLRKVFHHKQMRQFHKQQAIHDIEQQLNYSLKRLTKEMNSDIQFNQFLDEEFIQLCDKLNGLDDLSKRLSSTPVISLGLFIKNIIEMNNKNSKCLNDELKIFFLKVLIRMLTEKNKNPDRNSTPIDQWEPEFWNDSRKEVEGMQNFLDECGSASLVYQMFHDNTLQDNMELCSQLILFTSSLLLGGNTHCQNSILSRLKQDNSNVMLVNLKQIIFVQCRYVSLHMKQRRTTRKSSVNHINCNNLGMDYLDNTTYFSYQTETLKRVWPTQRLDFDTQTNQNDQIPLLLCRAFRMLQLFCENNNVAFKNYLRQQEDSDGTLVNSVNFVDLATRELRYFLKILNKNIIRIPMQIVDFLNEIIQLPCLLNQNALCKSTFFEDVCFASQFLSHRENQKLRGFDSLEQLQKLHELWNKVMQSILQVLEGNDILNYEVLQNKLDSKLLVAFIQQVLNINNSIDINEMLSKELKSFPNWMDHVMNVVIIQEKIKSKCPQSQWIEQLKQDIESEEQIKLIFTYCSQNIRRIEIFYENNYQPVFFPNQPVFRFLSGETRDKIMDSVPRDTQREKLIHLLSHLDDLFAEIEYNYSLNQRKIPITIRTTAKLNTLAQSLSLLINIIMVASFVVIIENQQSKLSSLEYEHHILQFLGYIQFIVSCIIYTFYLISRIPLEIKKIKTQNQHQNRFLRIAQIFWIVITADGGVSNMFYLLISGAGVFIQTYYFSVHLFFIFGRISILSNVFQAISYNSKQLLMVAALGVLFQFVFSLVGFNNYVDDIYPDVNPEGPCHSLLTCMITLMTSGVIGTSMNKWDPFKFFYDTVYFVFFALLFTNIISGIMIDTFAGIEYIQNIPSLELRDARQKIEDDKKNLCYICGIDRQTLEKNQEQFESHINNLHFLWNYIFYLYCLMNKDSTEFTGLEYWIMEKVQQENISWFPIVGGAKQDSIQERLSVIETKLSSIMNLIGKDIDFESKLSNEQDDEQDE